MARIEISTDYVVGQNYTDTNLNTDKFLVLGGNINFTNNGYRIYGGGGSGGSGGNNGSDGANTLVNDSSINIFINYGIMNGGGGGGGGGYESSGNNGGAGGGGGGGGGYYANGSVGFNGDLDGAGGTGGVMGGGGGGLGSAGFDGTESKGGAGGFPAPGFGGFGGGGGDCGGGGGASGGGAGKSGGNAGKSGGKGGFGIKNNGSINTLINRQGYTISTVNVGGLDVYTIPLYITGNLPTNYLINIDDDTGRYGQLFGKEITSTSPSPIFGIDPTSVITGLNNVGESKIYTNISNGFTFSTTSGTQTIGLKTYNWNITDANLTITLSGIICYNKDTTVLTKIHDIEQYIKIQDLIPGNLIKTYKHGFKPLKYLLNANVMTSDDVLNSMYIIKKDSTNNLNEDLIVSGGHYLLVDNIDKELIDKKPKIYKNPIKIDDKKCMLVCDSKEAQRLEENKSYEIYHIILEGENERYGIFVNGGFLSETTSEKVLRKFRNFFKIIKK